jgi:hypothetical protein
MTASVTDAIDGEIVITSDGLNALFESIRDAERVACDAAAALAAADARLAALREAMGLLLPASVKVRLRARESLAPVVGAEDGEQARTDALPVVNQAEPGPDGEDDGPARASMEDERIPATANLVDAEPGHNATFTLDADGSQTEWGDT